MKEISKILPEIGIEVIGYNPSWIDEDFNPDGTRVCFLQDDGIWIMAAWCNSMDQWQTLDTEGTNDHYMPYNDNNSDPPTHWVEKPKFK